MDQIRLNERIMWGIREYSHGDESVRKFLTELCFEEMRHSGSWKWKDTYKKLLDKFSENWGANNED